MFSDKTEIKLEINNKYIWKTPNIYKLNNILREPMKKFKTEIRKYFEMNEHKNIPKSTVLRRFTAPNAYIRKGLNSITLGITLRN